MGFWGERRSPRKVVGFVGGVGREDGLDVFGFGEDVFVIAVWALSFVCLCYRVIVFRGEQAKCVDEVYTGCLLFISPQLCNLYRVDDCNS